MMAVGALGKTYEQTRTRITDLVAGSDDATTSTSVPACPEWTMHDLLAHLAGICSDIIAGNVRAIPDKEWTSEQVESRRLRTVDEILSEWAETAPQVEAVLDNFPGQYGPQLIADVTAHEHDIRGALGRPGQRESEGISTGLSYLMNVLVHPSMSALGVGPVEVRADGMSWIVGRDGPPTGDPDAAWREALLETEVEPPPDQVPSASLAVAPFELFRAICGRRSAAQIKRLEWTGDPEPHLTMFGLGPFTIRPDDLVE